MSLYKNSKMLTYYATDGIGSPYPCQVRLGGGTIAVSYHDEGVTILFEGVEVGAGHFKLKLKAPSVEDTKYPSTGRATLHFVPDEEILEGWWTQDRQEGMWRIYLEH